MRPRRFPFSAGSRDPWTSAKRLSPYFFGSSLVMRVGKRASWA